MLFQNLTIDKVIIHEVYRRGDSREIIPPTFSNSLLTLDQKSIEALGDRIVTAMGKASQSMEMDIINSEVGDLVSIAKVLASAEDEDFIQQSQAIATKLSNAQNRRDIPGGILVIFSGLSGHPAVKVIGAIKAEIHSGFTKHYGEKGELTLQFLTDLILTPQTKLYKIGAFVEVDAKADVAEFPAGWKAVIYDDLMTSSNRLGAAQYFYEGFLGCAFPETNARYTKEFHDLTKNFIQSLNITEEGKIDLHNALITYLKTDQNANLEVAGFSQQYFNNEEIRDSYVNYMEEKEFPQNAIQKDLQDVATSLKFRRVTFGGGIKLLVPSEIFEAKVKMRVIDGAVDENGQIPKWTEIIIKDRICGQE